MTETLVKCFSYGGQHAHTSCHLTGSGTWLLFLFACLLGVIAASTFTKH